MINQSIKEMNASKHIMQKLDEVFAPMDLIVVEAAKKWGVERFEAVKEFIRSKEYKEITNTTEKYDKLHAIAGGKTWYNVFNGRNKMLIEEFMVKNCEMVVKKRNASIAKKLEKAGVSEVLGESLYDTKDGFNGFFKVVTDKGIKNVNVETIMAGGYNIQCLHLRVLVKLK